MACGQEMWTLVVAPRSRWAGHFLMSLGTFINLSKASMAAKIMPPMQGALSKSPEPVRMLGYVVKVKVAGQQQTLK